MLKIGIISDTHGYLSPKVIKHLQNVDEIWHAGDIGSLEVLKALKDLCPSVRIVYGNIDDALIRSETKEFLRFKLDMVEVLITHIAGKPGNYSLPLKKELQQNGAPDILVCGHSHILLVKMDKLSNMLWINPGACGNKGFHKLCTMITFNLDQGTPKNMQVIEWAR
ncbi:MAG: YfcE family phosphodiesterase [Crocinitomicaceae bacterium]|nr:YfcE family phosphodiesterase [Crocinitomicaceae bacterium]